MKARPEPLEEGGEQEAQDRHADAARKRATTANAAAAYRPRFRANDEGFPIDVLESLEYL